MTLVKRFDHVNITVRDLRAVTAFFVALGLEPDGDPQLQEGRWLEDVIGIAGARVEVVTLRVPGDGPGVELSQYHAPAGDRAMSVAPPDEPGLRSIAFEVDDLDAALSRVRSEGCDLVHTVGTYRDVFRLCYVRGPEGVIVMLAERIGH